MLNYALILAIGSSSPPNVTVGLDAVQPCNGVYSTYLVIPSNLPVTKASYDTLTKTLTLNPTAEGRVFCDGFEPSYFSLEENYMPVQVNDADKILSPWFDSDERKVLRRVIETAANDVVDNHVPDTLDGLSDVDATAPDHDDEIRFDSTTDTWVAVPSAVEDTYTPTYNGLDNDISFENPIAFGNITYAGKLAIISGEVHFKSNLVAPGTMDIKIAMPTAITDVYNTYSGYGTGSVKNLTTGVTDPISFSVVDSQDTISAVADDTTGNEDSYYLTFAVFVVLGDLVP